MSEPPSKHEPNPAAGITPEIAAELDRAMAEMESGDPESVGTGMHS
jgi:hypothetical protein